MLHCSQSKTCFISYFTSLANFSWAYLEHCENSCLNTKLKPFRKTRYFLYPYYIWHQNTVYVNEKDPGYPNTQNLWLDLKSTEVGVPIKVASLTHWFPGLFTYKQSIGFCDSVFRITIESGAVLINWRLEFSGNVILT